MPEVDLLQIENVSCHFGGLKALDETSFGIRRGTVTGLIGPNGAGKTTVFNCISGFQRKSGGRVLFDGHDITHTTPERISEAGMVRTFQLARGCPRMTVFEHLLLYGPKQPGEAFWRGLFMGTSARTHEQQLRDGASDVARRLKLDHVVDNLVGDLSGGQKKLLEIGRVLMARPKLILLDEPMAGVNPALVEQISAHLSDIRDEGITILLIEHEMSLIERLCDDVVVMADGKFLTRGSFMDVASNHLVQAAYLGMAAA